MKIFHRISLNIDCGRQVVLQRYGIELPLGLQTFEIEEDERWGRLEELLKQWNAVVLPDTRFTSAEMSRAPFFVLQSVWHWGYPQPESGFRYLKATYDLSSYDPVTRMGLVQNAPFQMKGEPKWGRKDILQLNWVFDVFFVKPDIWRHIFKPLNIECLPVLNGRTGEELKTVVQLKPQGIAESFFDIDNSVDADMFLEHKRYAPSLLSTGFPPSLIQPSSYDFFLSREYFGSGQSSFRAVIVSKRLYETLSSNKIRGVDFIPMNL